MLRQSQNDKQKMQLKHEQQLLVLKESIKLIEPKDQGLVGQIKELKQEMVQLKLKNAQLREQELFARLALNQKGHNHDLKTELAKQAEINKQQQQQLVEVKHRLDQYELQFDGLTREQLVQQNKDLKLKVKQLISQEHEVNSDDSVQTDQLKLADLKIV